MNFEKLVKQINVRVSTNLHNRLVTIANSKNLKIADVIREALICYYKDNDNEKVN
jgi:predicted HicB family RNase H-like nuclease